MAPFKEAQKTLEDEKFVNLSLLPIIIHELRLILDGLLGAVDMEVEPELFDLVEKILEDFKVRWGDLIVYRREVSHGYARRMEGIPFYAYWAALLDLHTKVKTSRILPERKGPSVERY